ncbi:MAG TPA: DMT family transporter [Acidimicrobiia bacterium]|nr:DMT family transporter [Acidimicrobiia bacterium]
MNPWTPLVAATFGWACSAVISRALLVDGMNTWTLIPLRMGFALISLFIVMAFTRRFWTTDGLAWRLGGILGVAAMAVPMVLMTLGLEDLPVSLGSLLIALIPISTIAAAHFLVAGETFRAKSLPGLLIALVGTGVLVGVGGESIAGVDDLWRGVGFTVAGVVVAGIGGALTRRYALVVPGDKLVLPQFTINTVVVVVLLPLLFDFEISSVEGADWLLLAVVGVLGSTVAFTAFLIAASVNPASRLALTGYSVPVLAVAMAVLFLDESLTLSIVVGAALIIVGVVLTERANKAHVPEPVAFGPG